MKIAFFGTGSFSRNILAGIFEKENIEILAIISQPDKEVGRKKILEQTETKKFALEHDIPIFQPKSLKNENSQDLVEFLKSLDLDFIVVVAYGKIMPKNILDIPKFGSINVHGSILPNYRGASPVQESLKNGDSKTGLTIMFMSEGMDEGDIVAVSEINIDIVDKNVDIFKKFENIGPDLLYNSLKDIISGKANIVKQDNSLATYCSKIEKENGFINFEKETSLEIYNKFRAYYGWPGIYTFYKGKKLNLEDIFFDEKTFENKKIGEVIKMENGNIGIVCADYKAIILKSVKLEGKNTVKIKDFINGNHDFIGSVL